MSTIPLLGDVYSRTLNSVLAFLFNLDSHYSIKKHEVNDVDIFKPMIVSAILLHALCILITKIFYSAVETLLYAVFYT